MARNKRQAPRRKVVRFRPPGRNDPPPPPSPPPIIEPRNVTKKPGVCHADIPVSMTHAYRVRKDPTDAMGPLAMYENVFQLESYEHTPKVVESCKPGRRDPSSSRVGAGKGLDSSSAHDPPNILVSPADEELHRAPEGRLFGGTIPMLESPADSSRPVLDAVGPRWWHGSSAASMDSRAGSFSPVIGAPDSLSASRRASLSTQTEIESSRGPSPATSSSQDSAFSSADGSRLLWPSGSLERATSIDKPFEYPEQNFIGPQQTLYPGHHYSHPGFHVHQHYLYHPASLSCPDFQNLQHFPYPSQPWQLNPHPSGQADSDTRPEKTAQSASLEEASQDHAVQRQPPSGPSGSGSFGNARFALSDQMELSNPLLYPVPAPYLSGPGLHPFLGFYGYAHPTDPSDPRPHSVSGNFDHNLVPPTLPANKHTTMDSLDTQLSVPRPLAVPPLNTVTAPMHMLPPMRHLAPSYSVPLYPPYRFPAISKSRSWTAHFEALEGQGKRSRKRSKAEKASAKDEQEKIAHQCPLCDRSFARRNGLAIHLKWHYKERDGKLYRCYQIVCSTNWYTTIAEDLHMPSLPHLPSLQGLGINVPTVLPMPERSPNKRLEPIFSPEIVATAEDSSPLALEPSPEFLYTPPRDNAAPGPSSHGLLSVCAHDLPGPITPLATPPPTPGGSRPLSFDCMSDFIHTRQRSDSTRSMWDLFGSDD